MTLDSEQNVILLTTYQIFALRLVSLRYDLQFMVKTVPTCDCACTRMYYAGARNNVVYTCVSIRVQHPTRDRLNIFNGLFLKEPRAVLFHAAAIHDRDIEDATLFVLE